jgi:hypothetical protein
MQTLLSAEYPSLCFGLMEMVHIGKTSSGLSICQDIKSRTPYITVNAHFLVLTQREKKD